ncbi:hypothetical protein Ahia01_000459300 [Argonauta hians]
MSTTTTARRPSLTEAALMSAYYYPHLAATGMSLSSNSATSSPHATLTYNGTPSDLVASPFHSMTAYSLESHPSSFGHAHHHPHGHYTHSHNSIANSQMAGSQWSHLAAAAHHLNYNTMTATTPAAQHMAAVAAATAAAAAAAGGNPTLNSASPVSGGGGGLHPLGNLTTIDVDSETAGPNESSIIINSNSNPSSSLTSYDEWMATSGYNLVIGSNLSAGSSNSSSTTPRGSSDSMLISMSPLHSQDSQTVPLSLLSTSSSNQHHLQQQQQQQQQSHHLQPLHLQSEQLSSSQQEDQIHSNESTLMANLSRYHQAPLSRPMIHTEYLGNGNMDIGTISSNSPESVSSPSQLSDDSLSSVDIHQSQQQQQQQQQHQLPNHHHNPNNQHPQHHHQHQQQQHLSHSMHVPSLNSVSNNYLLNSSRNGSLHLTSHRTNSNDGSLCTDIDSSPSSILGYPGDNIGRVNRHPFEWMRTPPTNNSRNKRVGRTRTKDKYRSVYTDHQRLELEKEFHYNVYIDVVRKAELAQELGLSQRQIKIWFQNRRAKDRKLRQRQANRGNVSVKLEPVDTLLLSSSLPSPEDSPASRNSCEESVIV